MSRLLGQEVGIGEDSKSHLAARIEELRLQRDRTIVQRDWLGGKLEQVLSALEAGKTPALEAVRKLREQLPTYYDVTIPAGIKDTPPTTE